MGVAHEDLAVIVHRNAHRALTAELAFFDAPGTEHRDQVAIGRELLHARVLRVRDVDVVFQIGADGLGAAELALGGPGLRETVGVGTAYDP